MILRGYQRVALQRTEAALREHGSTLLVMATGTGKTVIFSHLIGRLPPDFGRTMILSHRRELIDQSERTARKITGGAIDVEQAARWATSDGSLYDAARVVISTIQTQISGRNGRRRMERFRPDEFGLVVVDECFPAETLVDNRPIETFRVGDDTTFGRVTRCFRRETTEIVKIDFVSGRSLSCTPNHPIFDGSAFVPAGSLTKGNMVLTIMPHDNDLHHLRARVRRDEQQSASHMLTGLREDGSFQTPNSDPQTQLFCLPARGARADPHVAQLCAERTGLLLSDVRMATCANGKLADNEPYESQACSPDFGAHENEQSNEQSRRPRQGCHNVARDGLETQSTGWKRVSSYHSTASPGCGNRLGNGSCGCHKDGPHKRISTLLQARHCQSGVEDRNRNRRPLSRCNRPPGVRSEKRDVFGFDRVATVTVHKPGRGDGFERLCPNGIVYNLEIEPAHIYSANGVIVHNCHHSPAASYRAILSHYQRNPRLWSLGVTATPDRHDQRALGQVFESTAWSYDIADAVHDGWLVPIIVRSQTLEGWDISEVGKSGRDLNQKQLAGVMERPALETLVAENVHRVAGGRKTLLFAVSIAQSQAICDRLNGLKPEVARHLSCKTPDAERDGIIRDYRKGKFRYLCNVGVATEGFDVPDIEVIVIARPTCSRSLYAQMVGRGTRVLPGTVDDILDDEQAVIDFEAGTHDTPADHRRKRIAASCKPHLEILEFTGNSGRHRLACPADVLGGRYEAEEIALADRITRANGKPVEVAEALEQARRELEAKRAAERARAQREVLAVKGRWQERRFDPLAVLEIQAPPALGWEREVPATEAQVAFLKKLKIPADGLTLRTASLVIGDCLARRKRGLATPRMALILKRYGYDGKIGFDEGKRIIDRIAANGWRRPS